MRNLFTVNVKTKEHGLEEFLIRKSDNALKAQFDENAKSRDITIKKKFFPLISLSLVALTCGAVFIAIFMGALKDTGFAQTYSDLGWSLYIGIAGLALFAILGLIAFIWLRKFMVNPQSEEFYREQEELEDKICRGLRIPKDCTEIDIMCRRYKTRKGKEKYQYNIYENLPMWVFLEEGNLCFADTYGVWAVPVSCISSVNFFPGHAKLSSWNKEDWIDSPKYKRTVRFYKGEYVVKGYCSLQFICRNEEWEILIPEYDVDYIYGLIGKYPDE